MQAKYRRLTPDQRADHVETLTLIGRMVVLVPVHRAVRRSFVVVSASVPTR